MKKEGKCDTFHVASVALIYVVWRVYIVVFYFKRDPKVETRRHTKGRSS